MHGSDCRTEGNSGLSIHVWSALFVLGTQKRCFQRQVDTHYHQATFVTSHQPMKMNWYSLFVGMCVQVWVPLPVDSLFGSSYMYMYSYSCLSVGGVCLWLYTGHGCSISLYMYMYIPKSGVLHTHCTVGGLVRNRVMLFVGLALKYLSAVKLVVPHGL